MSHASPSSHAALPNSLRAICAGDALANRAADTTIVRATAKAGVGEPLIRHLEAPSRFPIDALGPVLAPAAQAIIERTQCAPATAGNAVLAAGALAAQVHRDVRLPHGQVTPLSLFIATICESGERKTSADQLALAAVREAEADLRTTHRKAYLTYINQRDAYNAQRSQDRLSKQAHRT
jgi:hypothetical protein